MSSEARLDQIVEEFKELAGRKAADLDHQNKQHWRKLEADLDEEIEKLKKRAQESVGRLKGWLIGIGTLIVGGLIFAVAALLYPSFKDVNSLQKDVLSARTEAAGAVETLRKEIDHLEATIKEADARTLQATKALTETQATYRNRITEVDAMIKQVRTATR